MPSSLDPAKNVTGMCLTGEFIISTILNRAKEEEQNSDEINRKCQKLLHHTRERCLKAAGMDGWMEAEKYVILLGIQVARVELFSFLIFFAINLPLHYSLVCAICPLIISLRLPLSGCSGMQQQSLSD
jgi:hypothetical protein